MSLEEIRAGIDSLDDEIVALLARRQEHVAAAAAYKVDDAAVRAPERRAAVMARLDARARAEGVDPDVVARTWTTMIDAFIEVERRAHRDRAPVRDYLAADRDAVVALSLRAWAPVFASLREQLGPRIFDQLHPDWRAGQRRAVEAACDDGSDGQAWVAEVDGVVAGFVALGAEVTAGLGEIQMLAVDPDHQRRGLGAALTAHATARLRARGARVVMVETGGDPGHAPARALYEGAGFTALPVARYFRAAGAAPRPAGRPRRRPR